MYSPLFLWKPMLPSPLPRFFAIFIPFAGFPFPDALLEPDRPHRQPPVRFRDTPEVLPGQVVGQDRVPLQPEPLPKRRGPRPRLLPSRSLRVAWETDDFGPNA